jgi:hypothetical protein
MGSSRGHLKLKLEPLSDDDLKEVCLPEGKLQKNRSETVVLQYTPLLFPHFVSAKQ